MTDVTPNMRQACIEARAVLRTAMRDKPEDLANPARNSVIASKIELLDAVLRDAPAVDKLRLVDGGEPQTAENVVSLATARQRISKRGDYNTTLTALDFLACALADHEHVWTMEERELYEAAVLACGGEI